MRMPWMVLGVLVSLAVLIVAGCGKRDDGTVRREGEPDYVKAFDEERMEAAISEARGTLDTFVAALEAREEGTEGFAVKKGFHFGGEGKEFIWVNEVRLADGGFLGRVNNEPVNAVGVTLGQAVQVSRDDVADWMFMSDGRLQGGYTIVALAHGTPEQDEYESSLGIDWSTYKFLGAKE